LLIDQYKGSTLYHHTKDSPFNSFKKDRYYLQEVGTKPRGVWFAFQEKDKTSDTWEEFCDHHRLALIKSSNKIQIAIDYPFYHHILYIRNGYDVFEVESKYKKEVFGLNQVVHLDWPKITEDYIGVILYEDEPGCLFSFGFELHKTGVGNRWLDNWSTYSGCIWRPEYVKILSRGDDND